MRRWMGRLALGVALASVLGAGVTEAAASGWKVRTYTSSDGDKNWMAFTGGQASEKPVGWLGRRVPVTLAVLCTVGAGREVMVSWDEGLLVPHGTTTINVRYHVDVAPVIAAQWQAVSFERLGTTLVLPERDGGDALAAMLAAGATFSFDIEMTDGTKAYMRFDLAGARAAIDKIIARCRPKVTQSTEERAGKAVFRQNCSMCHGDQGKGNGPAAPALNPKPTDLTAGKFKYGGTDAEIFKTISNGVPGTAMVSWASIPEKDRWNLVNYVKSLSGKK